MSEKHTYSRFAGNRGLSALLLCLLPFWSFAQEKTPNVFEDLGRPFITNFSPKNYKGATQNFGAAQDHRGIMYFANGEGVLEYDGDNWRMIKLSNASTVLAVAADPQGRVFVGGQGDFGVITVNPQGGKSVYRSLIPSLPDSINAATDMQSILGVQCNAEGTYFMSAFCLVEWKNGKTKVWRPQTKFRTIYEVDGEIYIRQSVLGICKLKNGKITPLKGGDAFAKSGILGMWKKPDGYIIVSAADIFFTKSMDDIRLEKITTEIDAATAQLQPYHATPLAHNKFLVATVFKGAYIMDYGGKVLQPINKIFGTATETALYAFADKNGGVWVCMNNGLSYMEDAFSARYWNAEQGLEGTVLDVIRHEDSVFVASSTGLYRMHDSRFFPVEGVRGQVFALESFKNGEAPAQLIGASTKGAFFMENGQTHLIPGTHSSVRLKNSALYPDYVYVSHESGVDLISKKDGQWVLADSIRGINEAVTRIQEAGGILYLTTPHNGLIEVKGFVPGQNSAAQIGRIKSFGGETNLRGLNVFEMQGKIYAYLGKNGFEIKNGATIPQQIFRLSEGYSLAQQMPFGTNGGHWVVLNKPDGHDIPAFLPASPTEQAFFNPFLRLPKMSISTILFEEGSYFWVGGSEGLFRYQASSFRQKRDKKFKTLIRKVMIGEDSVIHGGNFYHDIPGDTLLYPALEQSENSALKLGYYNDGISFVYAASNYEAAGTTEYSYFLEGNDNAWSHWHTAAPKGYTNLWEGNYVFRVKSRDIYGNQGEETAYRFRIAPPWFRTWPAYIAYLLLAAGALRLLVIMQTAKLKKDKIRLESIIEKRTEEITMKTVELEQQNEEIAAQRDMLEDTNRQVTEQKDKVEQSYQNIKLLSELGKSITANLSIDKIADAVYQNINSLMDASGFGIGLYNATDQTIDFHSFIEKGERLPFDSDELSDPDRLSVWCFLHQKEVFINDFIFDYTHYINLVKAPKIGEQVESVIYLPLSSQHKQKGVITVQSFNKNAYTDYHLNILRNLAVYATIAIENYEVFHLVEEEQQKSENLLLNILPKETAEELKLYGKATSKFYEKTTVLFTDFKGFTKIAEKLSAEELVAELDHCFRAFDRITKKHNLEKIKTIGDAYMCAGGIPLANDTNPTDAIEAALEMIEFIEVWKAEKTAIKERTGEFVPIWDIRIGIHTGNVVAGIVGENKFAYDIWGDAVNTASRMESAGEPNRINISGVTHKLIKDKFKCTYRGKVAAKNKGEIDMYFVDGRL